MRRLLIALTLSLCASSAASAQQQKISPAYANHVPDFAQIQRDTTGRNEFDVMARRMNTCMLFDRVVRAMSGNRFFRDQLTEREKHLERSFGECWSAGLQEYQGANRPRLFAYIDETGYNSAFEDSLLERYLFQGQPLPARRSTCFSATPRDLAKMKSLPVACPGGASNAWSISSRQILRRTSGSVSSPQWRS
jgi:hypothetical protein